MAEPAFTFRKVTVSLMPGFTVQQQFTVDGLRDGVTVVHGPNGIGKSTLARAMELLIWNTRVPRGQVLLEAEAAVAGAPQIRERKLENLAARTPDGAALDPDLPGAGREIQSRYRIGLRDLLQEGDPNEEFGALLRRELLGGVDLGKLREQVGARTRFTTNLGTRQVKAARDAKAAVETELLRQRAKENLEQEIKDLERDLAAAR